MTTLIQWFLYSLSGYLHVPLSLHQTIPETGLSPHKHPTRSKRVYPNAFMAVVVVNLSQNTIHGLSANYCAIIVQWLSSFAASIRGRCLRHACNHHPCDPFSASFAWASCYRRQTHTHRKQRFWDGMRRSSSQCGQSRWQCMRCSTSRSLGHSGRRSHASSGC